jgi:hypothetical protein
VTKEALEIYIKRNYTLQVANEEHSLTERRIQMNGRLVMDGQDTAQSMTGKMNKKNVAPAEHHTCQKKCKLAL